MRLWIYITCLLGTALADYEELYNLCRMFGPADTCLNVIINMASTASSSSGTSSTGSASTASSSSSASFSSNNAAASASAAAASSAATASSTATASSSSSSASSTAFAAAAVLDAFPDFVPFDQMPGGFMGPSFPGGSMGSPSISSSTSSNNGAIARTVTSLFPDGSTSAAASAFASGVSGLPFNNGPFNNGDPCIRVPPAFRSQCFRGLRGPQVGPPIRRGPPFRPRFRPPPNFNFPFPFNG